MHFTEVILYSAIVIALFGFALYQAFREVKKGDKSPSHYKNLQKGISMNTRKDVQKDMSQLVSLILKKSDKKSYKGARDKTTRLTKKNYDLLCDMESDGVYFPSNKQLREKYVREEYLNKIKNRLKK